jgi:hypothetical protein
MHHLAASLSASLLALFVSAAAIAEEPGAPATERFNIKSQPLSQALRAYAQQGVAHVICSLEPATPESLEWLAEALRIYRTSS